MDRGFAQLRRIHFAQALEAGDIDGALDLLALDFLQGRVALGFVQAIKHGLAGIHAKQRRHGDEYVTVAHEFGKVLEE